MAASSSSQSEFDPNKASKGMDKYSRQVGAYGVGVMRFLRELRVLVVGAKGIGIEAAKNLVLTGCKAVHLHDDGLAEIADLGTNFFLRPEHVGKPRAASLASFVQELNEDVEVEAVTGDVAGLLGSYGAVIVTDNSLPLATLTAWDTFCRTNDIVFTIAITSGVLGFLFADFGDKHICSDFDGEPHKYIAIQNITRNENGKYELQLDDPHELDDQSHIQIEDVEGIPEFKDKTFVMRRYYTAAGKLVPDRLIVDSIKGGPETDFTTWGTYEKGGYLREVKTEVEINHKPLAAALRDAQVLYPDQEKYFLGAPARLILSQSALWDFIAANGHLPRLHNTEDAAALQELAKKVHTGFTEVNAANVADLEPEEINKVALYARTEISGMCAFLGGVVAQEVIKKSSKWNPITQFLVHELFDLVDETVPAEATPVGSRYDHHLALFGKAFQDSLMNDKWFLVGCGALGCEYMKAFALMGISCGPEGLLNATDMDTIEVSNLARQFLFRREHVGKQKSACATAAARVMNPDMKIRVYTDMVAPKTEHVFHEVFWESLTGVVNALDNIQARLYVDSRCVLFKRPLLESGTLGTKANTEVIIPHLTASYGENHVEVKQKHVPQCTFKNFPYLIEHTIGWAGKAGEFATLFVEPANDLKTAIEDLDQFWKNISRLNQVPKKLERLRPLIQLLPKISTPTFETCVDLAFQRLLSQYRDRILTLTHHCPKDMMKTDRDSGKSVPFWSAPKRFPHPIVWDPTNPDHPLVEYIYNTANLYAHMFHLEPKRDLTEGRPEFKAYLVSLNLVAPEWSPGEKSGLGEVEEAEGGSESSGPKEDEMERDNNLLAEFTAAINNFDWATLSAKHSELKAAGDALIRPAEFEKDDDTNFHIDFVTSASNLRAANYGIPTADRHKTKMTAGNIIPAIATTTAMITGLNSIEFLKLKKGLPKHKIHNSNVNLGVSTFSLFEPEGPKKAVAEYDPVEMAEIAPVPAGFTIWDTIVIKEGDITLERFLQRFPEIHYGVVVDGILGPKEEQSDEGTRTKLIYSSFGLFAARVAGYMQKTITEIWQEEYGPLPASSFLALNVSGTLNGETVKIPNPVIYRYK